MRARSWWVRVLAVVLVLIATTGCASTGSGGSTTTPPAGTVASATATRPTTNANPPRLGGPIADFTAHYGQPNDHSTPSTGSYHYARFAGENTDSVIVQSGIAEGAAYSQLAELVLLAAPPSQSWDMTTARAVCGALDPADTSGAHSQPVMSAQGQLEGVDVVAHSAALAAAFPASAFADANQNPAPPGSFDTLYLYATIGDASSGVGSCQLATGTTQTQG